MLELRPPDRRVMFTHGKAPGLCNETLRYMRFEGCELVKGLNERAADCLLRVEGGHPFHCLNAIGPPRIPKSVHEPANAQNVVPALCIAYLPVEDPAASTPSESQAIKKEPRTDARSPLYRDTVQFRRVR